MIINQAVKETSVSTDDNPHQRFRQFLRQADKLIIDGQFEEAKSLIAEAKKINPANSFIAAFEERLALFEEKKSLKSAPAPRKNSPHSVPSTPAETSSQEPVPESPVSLVSSDHGQIATPPVPDLSVESLTDGQSPSRRDAGVSDDQQPATSPTVSLSEFEDELRMRFNDNLQRLVEEARGEIRREFEAEYLKRLESLSAEQDRKMELLGARVPETKEERLALYRQRLEGWYQDGVPAEKTSCLELRELLGLTPDEHYAVDSEVRFQLYMRNIEKRIISGESGDPIEETLGKLKRLFGITPEESSRLEPSILASLQRRAGKGRLLVVDDDLLLLETLEHLLQDSGYQVLTAADVGSALEKLESATVDFILSDIKFDLEELDGFNLFRTIQEYSHLRDIPFVFMSSFEDGVIIRSGMQLGIDDYLVKPVDPELLFAVIEGKLKRHRVLAQH